MSRNTLIGPLPTQVEIWSALAINWIGPKTSYKRAKQILKKAQFDNVPELYTFLMYNKTEGGYGTSIWTPEKVVWRNLIDDRRKSLHNFGLDAKAFLPEQRSRNANIRVLTYPQVYKEVAKICQNSLRSTPNPRYVKKGQRIRGRSNCRIEKIVPVPGNTAKDRLMKLIKSENRHL